MLKNKSIKRIISLLLLLTLCCGVLCSCAKSVVIPDVENLDVSTAKTLLASKGLIPKVQYQYNNNYEYDMVMRTEPEIGSKVSEDSSITLYVCKGPVYYKLSDSVGWIWNISGIENFKWDEETEDGQGTKRFYTPYVAEGYLYIEFDLYCKSKYDIEFYADFGTAAINDTFDKAVPIEVLYDSKVVNNKGELTNFKVKIPLTDLGVQKPTNIYVEFDFLVNNAHERFKAKLDLSW